LTDVAGYLRKMADDERRVDYGRALQQSAAARNFGNIGHNLYAIANNMLRAGYKGALQHFTGQIPLTGERDAQGARGALDAVGAAGLALGPLAGRALAQVAATPKPARGITAYHGSPHDFDRFDIRKIGTGEGSQEQGLGLYFTDNPTVAKGYQEELSAGGGGSGRLYEVSLKADQDDFLDMEKAWSAAGQSPQVGRALKSLFGDREYYDDSLAALMNTPDGIRKLAESGIPGIRYRGYGPEGSSGRPVNYVVFDDRLIEITKKMGIAVPIPGVPGVVVSEEDFNALQGMQDGAVR